MTKMLRWSCPAGTHPGALAPSRPRKDDLRRYCIPCSEKSGRLTERTIASKVLQTRKDKSQERSRLKAQKKAAQKRAAARANLSQSDLVTRFACGLDALGATLYSHGACDPLWEVRACKRLRQPRIERDHVVFYESPGLDKYDVRALVVLTELRWLGTKAAGSGTLGDPPATPLKGKPLRRFIRARMGKTIGVRPTLRGPWGQAWIEVSELLRARDAVEQLGHGSIFSRLQKRAS